MAPDDIDLTVDIEVPTAQALRRLAGRRVCIDCGANYSVSAPPKVNWTCDVCGGEVIQREDDTEEAIRRRLELYERQTAPLIDWYESRGQLAKVNGVGSPDAVLRRIIRAVEDRRRPGEVPMRRTAEEIAKMRRAGRVVAEMHEATRAAAKPGVTTAELDAVARDVLDRRGAKSNFLHYRGFPAVICTSPNDMIVHGIPGRLRPGGGRHPVHRLRGHHRGLPRRRRLHHGHRGGARPRPPRLIEVDRAQPVGRDRAAPRRDTGSTRWAGPSRTWPRGPGSRVVREYVGHAIGTAMHEEPQVPNYWPGQRRAHAQDGDGLRRGAHGQRRRARHPGARRRLERGHRRRQPVGPFRAHHRRHRRRPRGPDPALSPGPRRAPQTRAWSPGPGRTEPLCS